MHAYNRDFMTWAPDGLAAGTGYEYRLLLGEQGRRPRRAGGGNAGNPFDTLYGRGGSRAASVGEQALGFRRLRYRIKKLGLD